jgi:hypothetical protein
MTLQVLLDVRPGRLPIGAVQPPYSELCRRQPMRGRGEKQEAPWYRTRKRLP